MPGIDHCIQTRGPPVYARPRRLMPAKLAAAKTELDELVRRGILTPSQSPWASPIHLVPKDNGSCYRMVGCYERLNSITLPDRNPIPDIQTFADHLQGAKIFSKIDLARAFAQIRMSPQDQQKTAITTPFGLYEYTRMPFGLRNAAQTFQRLMDSVFRGLPRVFVYIDDILVFSRSAQEHRADLEAVFNRLQKYRLTVRPDKCIFGQSQIQFLGFQLSDSGLTPLPGKVSDLLDLPPPRNVADCRRFLGMLNYYHRFIPELASTLLPLHQLANQPKRQPFQWLPAHDAAFQEAKQRLAQAATLAFPSSQAPTQVIADASDTAVGAVIQQRHANRWVPVAFHSKKLTTSQLKWSTGDKELFALFSTVKRFRHLLEGLRDLQFCTDHKPLIYAFTAKSERSARVQRQLAFLSEFSTNIRHVEGANNVVSDCLSRPPQSVNSTSYDVSCADFKQLAEEQQNCSDMAALAANRSLSVEHRTIEDSSVQLLVDVSTGTSRPLVPRSLRRAIFDRFHNFQHPGVRATKRLLSERFVWQGMSSDIAFWCNTCLRCQSSKVGRHQRTQLLRPPAPSNRFEALHVDIVGPLPFAQGHQFIFTIVDRYTRYPEAIPLKDATAIECARALLSWIARFGICLRLTSDRGRQFISNVWRELCQLLGIQSRTTLAYEPHQNGLVERVHRDLKASLMATLQGDPNWVDKLPVILMGMRAAFKPDIGTTAAELVLGETLRLPGQYFDRCPDEPHSEFAKGLRSAFARLRPVKTAWHQPTAGRPVFVSSSLSSATHVFVRVDAHRSPLQAPYKGPYRVVERGPKSYMLELEAGIDSVSVDRLKPAFFALGHSDAPEMPISPEPAQAAADATQPRPVATRSGRVPRAPTRFADFLLPRQPQT
uniref:RNA-directed DNA polymerase n=1 Tax=Trichuris muris TaxID=70415 RepID=A0A5S6Q0Y3_TRIMR